MRLYSLVLLFLLALLTPFIGNGQFYQGSNMEFGKNRVQYKDFTWFYYPGEHFEVYYYIGGEKLAQYVLMSSEKNLPEMEAFFNFSVDDKLQVLSYLNLSEFRQSNIGITGDDQYNIGGSAKIMGSKMFTYFEGSHEKLDLQIRENIARVIFNQLMFGGDWKDILKSSTLLSIPYWYQEGIIAYAAQGNTNESETFMKDLVRFGKFKTLNHFEGREAQLIGQAFWSYINEVYGSAVLPNIIYMAQAGRNIDSGFLYILGMSLEELSNDFINFYKEKNAGGRETIPLDTPAPDRKDKTAFKSWKKEQRYLGDLKVKYKKKYQYSQFKLSPDGENMAFVTNELGQYRIWVYNFSTKKKKCILKREHKLARIVDETFPTLTWHPSGKTLTYIFERRDNPWIGHYSLEEKKHQQKELFLLEKVLDIQYSQDGKKMIMSAANRGQSDIFLYHVIGNNQEQLTNDIYDDLNPRFVDNDTRVIFSSNRPDDTLRTKVETDTYPTNKDIYLFDVINRGKTLERLTNTPDVNEDNPSGYSNKHYTYLANNTDYYNRYLSTIDSTISAIDTAIHYRYFTTTHILSGFKRDAHDYQMNPNTGDYTAFFYKRLQPRVAIANKSSDNLVLNQTPQGNSNGNNNNIEYKEGLILSKDTLYKGQVDINDYVFEDERTNYSYEKETIRAQEAPGSDTTSTTSTPPPVGFQLPNSRNYRLNFATDYVVTQFNNSFSNLFYQNVTGPNSMTPGFSAFTKFGTSDLFEDYKIVGGFRLAIGLNSFDFGLSFENLKSRWDKKYIFIRQSSQSIEDDYKVFRNQSNTLIYQTKYPFNEVMSLRISGIGRYDSRVRQSNEIVSLAEKTTNTFNIGLKLEYVFDNTIAKGLNLYNGTRGKIWAERYQQPSNWKKRTDVNVIGFDFRNYQRIHRDIIFATRFAGASAFGYKGIVHYLGGVDNWMGQRVDNTVQSADTSKYAYQAFAGPMRGFYLNSRSGNNVAMASAEVRFPVFKYLMRRPIKSDFVENFQVVTFLDAGCAWTGRNPYSEENVFNRTVLESGSVTLTIDNNREPIIYGYGFGLRSRLLGYFVRADWAWGIDDGRIMPRVFYLSLNLDF